MEPKKISFGFMKTKKADKPVVEERRDYIECVEEKAIKVVGGETNTEKPSLVIPMKPNTLVTAERLREIAEKVEKDVAEESQPQIKTEPKSEPAENETLDQMAVRELLEDAKKDVKVEISELTVPIPAKVVLEGEKESTLEDYESVPIQDFGMAMLRGMGWTPGKDGSKYKLPELRPKGLGLGADKVVKDNQKKNASKNNDEQLTIVKNAFVKIVTGKYSGCYGKVVSLDEDNGRVMVDIPIRKETVSVSEFMLQPVTKAEFDKESRVINQDTYEEYKKKEKSSRNESSNVDKNLPSSSTKSNDLTDRKERKKDYRDNRSSNGNRDRKRRDSSSSAERGRKTKRDDSVGRDRRSKKRDKSEEKIKKRYDSSGDERNPRTDNRYKSEERKRRDSLSEERDHRRKNRDESEERSKTRRESPSPDKGSRKKKDKKKYSSNESLDSLSDEKKRKHKNKSRKKSHSDSESDDYKKNKRRSKTPEGKRDIDKKRKGKKKKRDRDRSPNYKKHRK